MRLQEMAEHRGLGDARDRVRFGLIAFDFMADELPGMNWQPLHRRPRYEVQTEPRARPEKVKERIVREREFQNIVLQSQDVAEMPYRPVACGKTYRLIAVRKNLTVMKGELRLFDDYRCFFNLTNDWDRPAEEIVFSLDAPLPTSTQWPAGRKEK